MTIARSLTFSVGLLIWSTQIQGHEFWIEPSKHYTTVNSTVELTLKVGETFRGSAQPYLPVDTATFIVIGQTKREIKGLLGDSRPAATVAVDDGLNRVIHQTTPFSIRFGDDDERWANYITLDGLQRQLDQHPAIPQIVPVTERYVRVAKSFIKTGQAKVNDSLSGEMPFRAGSGRAMDTDHPWKLCIYAVRWTNSARGRFGQGISTQRSSCRFESFHRREWSSGARVTKCRPVSHQRSRYSARR